MSEVFVLRPRFWLDERQEVAGCGKFDSSCLLLTATSTDKSQVERVVHALRIERGPQTVQLPLVAAAVSLSLPVIHCGAKFFNAPLTSKEEKATDQVRPASLAV